ncbi:protein of unknown function [Nannocystis exedens]|uniref:DUF4377 domain-containing protein n=2 Tax=Nannocystis exedens TaxID=54 RepID=A0A1I1V6Z1_9BACT|nr:DUF4377 domain-containing protein [Nannocystis exedens]PCC72419.1 hypothetical protein NAEX_05499 [Nannocystis exedens]SFD78792.1 protein of unknown function [Nannocystis exedens]
MRPRSKPRATSLLVLCLTVLAPACGPKEAQEVVVASRRSPCVGAFPMLCLRYSEDGGEFETTYNYFEGFTHRWGVETRLRYHVEPVADPGADQSDERWIADEIVSEEHDPVGTRYTLGFSNDSPDSGWFVPSGDRLLMLDTEVDCAPELCADVLQRIADGTPFSATFELTADEDVPLRLLSLADK